MVSSVTVGRLKPGTNMKLKTVEINGKQYAEIDTAGLPVYVHDDGKEIGFDAPLATKKITELNGEAKNHRLAKEAAEEKLAKFAAIEDPKKAIEALEMLSKIDQKKLLDAGQVDQVKAEITKNFQQQLDEEKQRSQMLEKQLYDSMIGGSFAGSKYIADKIAIPADLLQARFGQAFKVEEGRIVAYDASGNKIYSRAKPGELAQFDEALEFLVENYPQKDYILKASGNNGGGSRPTQHDIGQKTMKRSAFDALDVAASGWELVSGLDSSLLHLFTITQIFKEYLIMAGNTLTGLIPTIYTALDVVSREQVGFIPAVAKNAKADAAAKDQTVTAPVAPEAKTEDIVPGPSAPNTGDQNIGTVDVKITKSKMAPVKWNGEEQLALGPSGTYNTILADQFKQAFRALANEVEADLGALYFGASRAVGTAGTTPFGVKDDLSDAALARQVLEDNGAPTTDLQMVLGSTAIANLRGKQSVLFKVNESGTEQLLREGVLGRLEGFNIHSSAGVKRAPKVAATGYLVNGEKKEGDVLISIDTGSGSISAGQIVTFAGDPNQYVVAAATSNLITLAAPGLRQDLADDTAITVVGAFTANMAFDRNAFLLASRTPAMPEGGDNADDVMNVTDPISGITFQIALYRQYRQVRYEVGLAWGVSSVKPAHGCLILG
ncbi:Plastid ribosomal protein L11 [Trichuris trichiura]|nr:Plastid ribosomal protein L11 [Trichuris trichiura]